MPKHQITCGSQHHLIVKCRFHLSTFIDGILISTVGEYVRNTSEPEAMIRSFVPGGPRVEKGDPRETVGLERFYETYVFNTDDDWTEKKIGDYEAYQHPRIVNWSEIDSRSAQTAREATSNHWVMVDKYGGTQ